MPGFRKAAYCPFALNYTRIREKLAEPRVGRGARSYPDRVFIRYPTVWVHALDAETVALRLHRTDIIKYHANGDRTLCADGWADSVSTREWWGAAGVTVRRYVTNAWTPSQLAYVHWGVASAYYDNMRIAPDGRPYEPKPLTRNVPNAEAKALRLELRECVRELGYLDHVRMMDTVGQWVVPFYVEAPKPDVAIRRLMGGFDYELLCDLLRTVTNRMTARDTFNAAVTRVWEQYVRQRAMFDVQEVHSISGEQ